MAGGDWCHGGVLTAWFHAATGVGPSDRGPGSLVGEGKPGPLFRPPGPFGQVGRRAGGLCDRLPRRPGTLSCPWLTRGSERWYSEKPLVGRLAPCGCVGSEESVSLSTFRPGRSDTYASL